jgi:hypothetical protein
MMAEPQCSIRKCKHLEVVTRSLNRAPFLRVRCMMTSRCSGVGSPSGSCVTG